MIGKMIVGFSIKTISADRKDLPRGRIDINSTPRIISVNESKMDFLNKKPLNIEFEFTTKYEPEIAEIRIFGSVLYVGKDIKNALKIWKEKKILSKEIDIEVKNFLFRKCLSIGMSLSENMQLPPPLMFPRVVPRQKEELTYIG
ncbi:MAG: hypothetical protein QMD36_00590 [Candidatus Aenigmarchaeota archaeon]|nr:hypothetical protein [Candidatus Aenigmarchaeota archaeon]